MEKQEKACTVWLNSLLQPAADATFGDNLATKRLAAKLRALLWKLYSEDEGVISVMLRLEKRIDDGFLRLREEVKRSTPDDFTDPCKAPSLLMHTKTRLRLHCNNHS